MFLNCFINNFFELLPSKFHVLNVFSKHFNFSNFYMNTSVALFRVESNFLIVLCTLSIR